MRWVGVDVGGTFTDGVAYDDEDHVLSYAKALSTPSDPTSAVLDVVTELGVPLDEVHRFVHGVTIGTNAILEGKGAEVWLLVTRGFRDVLEIARTNRSVLYDIRTLKPPPLVPRTRTLEIGERLLHDGTVLEALEREDVHRALARIPVGPEIAIAIGFLHSYADSVHEEAARGIVTEARPDQFVCISSEVLPQFREYERLSTTVLNAYIGPLMARYLSRLRAGLVARGYRRAVYIMSSNGGVSTVERARRLPLATVLSGPAGGVAAAVHLGRRLGFENLITCDMGGTSTDVCLIEGLRIPLTDQQVIAEYANRTPQIEINSVGAGGGSIGWLDAGDILNVGPRSAGADPGPACYGHGGAEPTVTDANLVLDRLADCSPLAGGRIRLDRELAVRAVDGLGQRIGLAPVPTADGIVRLAVARMVSAIKQISISDGFDPRDFILVAFGGAGPMHAVAIAEELEIERIVIPVGPGNFAAFGSLISDVRRDYVRTRTTQLLESEWESIVRVFGELEERAEQDLRQEGVARGDIELGRSAGMRYLGQSWELNVDLGPGVTGVEDLVAAFADVHDRRFGHRGGEVVEVVNFRVAAIGRVAKPQPPAHRGGASLEAAVLGHRCAYFGGSSHDTPVYARHRLPIGERFDGPAILEESGSTTVVAPGWQGRVLEHGEVLLEGS